MYREKRQLSMKNRVWAIVVSVVMMLSGIPINGIVIHAEGTDISLSRPEIVNESDIENMGLSLSYLGYYKISNVEELAWFAGLVNGDVRVCDGITIKQDIDANALLIKDIVVNERLLSEKITVAENGTATINDNQNVVEWNPIGSEITPYTGMFDGNGHTISGIFYKDTTQKCVGLFGVAENGAILRNLTISDTYICAKQQVGGIVGNACGVTIENCINEAVIKGYALLGGIAGKLEEGEVRECKNAGTVIGSGHYIGGLVGTGKNGILFNCNNSGKVMGSSGVGGAVGDITDTTVNNFYNIGDIDGKSEIGGVVGSCVSGYIKNTFNYGQVTSRESLYVGSIAGRNSSQLVLSNNFCLEGTAKCVCEDNIVTRYAVGVDIDVVPGNSYGVAEEKTEEEFASGEVAYYLQEFQETNLDNGKTQHVWGQEIGKDAFPIFEGCKVYSSKPCAIKFYNVEQGESVQNHMYGQNGICSVCGTYKEPVYDEYRYKIENVGELYWFAGLVNGNARVCKDGVKQCVSASAVLSNDIVINDSLLDEKLSISGDGVASVMGEQEICTWTPIGFYENEYTGCFDGNGHIISGLYFSNGIEHYAGLFGKVKKGVIYNLGLTDSYIYGTVAAGIVAHNDGGQIQQCFNEAIVIGKRSVGGIAAYQEDGFIYECGNKGIIKINQEQRDIITAAGGVLGGVCQGIIRNSYNIGQVTGKSYVGGICGGIYDKMTSYNTDVFCKIENSYNYGQILGTGPYCIGSLTGYKGDGTLENNYYVTGTAILSSEGEVITQGAVGNYENAIKDNIEGEAIEKTREEFASGEVAYRLQKGQKEDYQGAVIPQIWGQDIGNDLYPILFSDAIVYGSKPCATVFSNRPGIIKEHDYDEYEICKYCKQYRGAEYVDGWYQIENAKELYWFAGLVNGDSRVCTDNVTQCVTANAVLINDIVINEKLFQEKLIINENYEVSIVTGQHVEEWNVMGDINFDRYNGIFDGAGHTIRGLYVTDMSNEYVGLFGYTGINAVVKNLTLEDSYIKGKYHVGGIVGHNGGVIENCVNKSMIMGTESIGGVAGHSSDGMIVNCCNEGDIKGYKYAGGISGFSSSTEISNCYNIGCVTGTESVGGISGRVTYYSEVKNSYNYGQVLSNGGKYTGGIAGYLYNATLKNTFYLEGCVAIDTGEQLISQNAVGTSNNIPIVIDKDEAQGKSEEAFVSGEVAYLLQYAQNPNEPGEVTCVWGQNIGVDPYPRLRGKQVYATLPCASTYSNSSNETKEHVFGKGGCCKNCGGYTKPAYIDGKYQISTAGELYWFAGLVNGDVKVCVGNIKQNLEADAVLTEDIVLNDKLFKDKLILSEDGTIICKEKDNLSLWVPIGMLSGKYNGEFDGQNHTISGLYYNDSEEDYIGLFGYTDENAVVKNLILKDSYIHGSRFTGGIVGANYGTIQCCTNEAVITGSSWLGGITGYLITGKVIDCSNLADVFSDGLGAGIGGIAGYVKNSDIMRSYNRGDVTGFDNIGGVAGLGRGSDIINCYNTGNVSGYRSLGGITGYAGENTYIKNTYNFGMITGNKQTNAKLGSIAGERDGVILKNNYYLKGSAVIENNTTVATQNAIGGKDAKAVEDVAGETNVMNVDDFLSGKVCWLLQQAQEMGASGIIPLVWGQDIGVEKSPALSSKPESKVYYSCEVQTDGNKTERYYNEGDNETVTPKPEEPETETPKPEEPETETPKPEEPETETPKPEEPNYSEELVEGDFDGNGTVELKDAQMTLRAALLLEKVNENQSRMVDVDGNGQVELADAQQILRKALLLIEEFIKKS